MSELIPGLLQTVKPDIYRLVAPNPSVMTGPGTNTYLLGRKNITVLDPGPDIETHLEAIAGAIERLGGRLQRVLVTHTHTDHSPGAATLARRFGVPTVGAAIADDGYQDESFQPDLLLRDGLCLDVDGGVLEAIHTPGHVGNHYCFLHRDSGALFTGDHIMQGSTVVIIPPAGDMADYVQSLRRLLTFPLSCLAPGHGERIDAPHREIEKLIAHRQGREDKVVLALTSLGAGDLDALLPVAYDDVPASIHPVARLSLHAHILKLEREGRATERAGVWTLTDGARP